MCWIWVYIRLNFEREKNELILSQILNMTQKGVIQNLSQKFVGKIFQNFNLYENKN